MPAMKTKEMASTLQIKEFDAETNVIKGYASTFGGEPDSHNDVVVKGAFQKTIQEDGNRIKFLSAHSWDAIVGKITEIYEDAHGLFIEAKISDTTAGRDLMTLVKDKVIDRMSIGYIPTKWNFDEQGVCNLEEIKLFEVSAVGLPSNKHAVITQAKEYQREKGQRQQKDADEDINEIVRKAVEKALQEKDAKPDLPVPNDEQVQKYLRELDELTKAD